MTSQQNAPEMTVKKTANSESEEKRKRLWVIWLAGVLILLGLAYAANNLGLLPEISGPNEWDKVEWADWAILGAGLWGLAINLFRTYSEAWPNPHIIDWVLSVALTVVGVSLFVSLRTEVGELVGAVAVVGLGVILLYTTLRKKDPA